MENKISIQQRLAETPKPNIVRLPEIAARYKALYKIFNMRDGELAYEAEQFHFAKLILDSEKLKECTPLSIYGCFLDGAVDGLSFDPQMKHCYLVPVSFKVIVNNREVWEKRAQRRVSAFGELALRIKQGQITHVDNPVLVFEGDVFKMGTHENKLYVTHEVILPRKSEVVIACYVRITRTDGSIDYKVLTAPELDKIRQFSESKDSKAWNNGYNGMFQTKTIKHAFRTYPKLKVISKFTQLETETEDEVELPDLYNIEVTNGQIEDAKPPKPKENPKPPGTVVKKPKDIVNGSPDEIEPEDENDFDQKQPVGETKNFDEDDW